MDTTGTSKTFGQDGTCDKTEIRMRGEVPELGTVTWSELVWSRPLPVLSADSAPPGLWRDRRELPDWPGHVLRTLQNNCFGVPLVCGDIVETAPPAPVPRAGAWPGKERYPQVVRVARLVDGLLVAAEGYRELSRSGPGDADGPAYSDMTCDCGHCHGPGLDAAWWGRCETTLLAGGACLVETDGDRIVAFFPAAGVHPVDPGRVRTVCAEAGLVPGTLRILDRAEREIFVSLRLYTADGDVGEEDAAA